MGRTMKEQRLMKELNINSWREMSKDKIKVFTSKLHMLDPEVAKKALDQFPDYCQLVAQVVDIYKDVTLKAYSASDQTVAVTRNAYVSTMDALKAQLASENLSEEVRMQINSQMVEIANRLGDLVKEGNAFHLSVLKIFAGVTLTVVGIAATLLGGHCTKQLFDDNY